MPTAQTATPIPCDEMALLAINGPIATITLNRPQSYNAINLDIAKRLEQAALTIESDDSLRVLVIAGAGRSFCEGGDLASMAASIDTIVPAVTEMLQHYHAFIATLRRMPKLVVTSVHGAAAGAGLSLAFMGDFCIAADDATFTAAYNKLGVSPDGGGTVGLVNAGGIRRALQIFMAEDKFSAAQAHGWGLVNYLVPAAELNEATQTLAEKLARNAPQAIAETKRMIYRHAQPLEAQLDAEKDAILRCMTSDVFKAALKSFISKGKT